MDRQPNQLGPPSETPSLDDVETGRDSSDRESIEDSEPESEVLTDPLRADLDSVGHALRRQRLLGKLFADEGDPIQLGHYAILGELGRGAMGVVYAARDTKLERQVAIKRLQDRGNVDLRERLVREAQAMAKLNHPNVVPIYEIGEDREAAFIVMEYVEGVTLRCWSETESRTLAQLIEVFTAAGRGLAAAHDKGMVHRDFKPDNVMVGIDGRVRVMDFGLARVEHASGDDFVDPGLASSSTVLDLTRGGALVGTPAYMAPEQLYGRRATPASDQFSYCVALFELLVGRRPFTAATLLELCARIEARDIDLGSSNSQLPTWLRELIVRGLEPVPGDRHGSMQALLDAIDHGARKTGLSEHDAPAYVFVAYVEQDKSVALRVCEGLLDHGVRPWIDVWNVPPNADPRTSVEQALRDAPALLLCHGRGGWERLRREGGEALQLRIESGPSSVHHVRLPHVSGEVTSITGHLGAALDEARWFEGIAELARTIGIDRHRHTWLADEAARVGLSAQELDPYVGPRPYTEAEARWLFGRSSELTELLELLRARRVVTIVGAPGSGKTSLLKAGVWPALSSCRVQSWQLRQLRTGLRPCESLAHLLLELLGPSGDALADAAKIAQLRDVLIADPSTLKLVLAQQLESRPGAPGQRLLLVIDDLDNLLPDAGREAVDAAELSSFASNLLAATRDPGALSVLVTLRSDTLAHSHEVPELTKLLETAAEVALRPLKEAQLRSAIVHPARRVGYEVERELVELLVALATRSRSLTLLQRLLSELWRRRDEHRRRLTRASFEPARDAATASRTIASEASLSSQSRRLGSNSTRLDMEEARRAHRERREALAPVVDPNLVFVARALRKRYPAPEFSLRHVDMSLRRGEVVGLVGTNGSGKTTLLRIIAAELMSDGGEIEYPALAGVGQWRDIKAGISYVPQESSRWHGPLQNTLRYEAALNGLLGRENDMEVGFMLERLGLEKLKDAKWSQISGGYKTRFALARALIRRPQLLVLDEPLAPLDVLAQELYLRDLRDIASNSRNPPAVILSSQHLHEVESIADRLMVLEHGVLRFDGVPSQLHVQLRSNCFELGFRGDPRAVEVTIARFGANAGLQRVGTNYMLTVAVDVTLEQVVSVLGEGAVELTYIRDISGSTRRLFEHGDHE